MSFTLGLFVGFCLGILCMVLLFQAKASDESTTALSTTPDEEAVSYEQSAMSGLSDED